mgnify:CR=1 FL=1
MPCILHIDMDAFFAAVELLRHPELRGEPVVVGGRGIPSERGVVSTASYEARRFGVHSGMPLRTASRRCPRCHFLPVDGPTYLKISEEIKAILQTYSPTVEEGGIDEAYLDLSETADPVAIAHVLKARIKKETGLTASVGIGPNKLLAKMASDLEKPNGLVVLAEADIQERLWPLPVRRLLGVGPRTEADLVKMGVKTIGELAGISRAALVEKFKPARGEYLHQSSHGIDDTPLIAQWEPKSVSHQATFQQDTDDLITIETELHALTDGLVRRLRNSHSLARSVSVKLRYADFESHTHALHLQEPTDDSAILFEAARKDLYRFDWEAAKKVRLVSVRFGDLHPVC